MKRVWLPLCMAACCLCFAARSRGEEPLKISACQLKTDPSAYNHKLVEVEAFVSHDFEDFTLFDPTCRSAQGIWLEYGGKAKSDTVYCCGPTAGKSRPQELTVENIPIPLVENDQFKKFDRQVQPPFRSGRFGSVVHAVLVGRFFAGSKQQLSAGKSLWRGYGHMGCCSLLAIQEVKSVSPQDRADLDYGASPDQPDLAKAGCGFAFLTPMDPFSGLLQAQRAAERNPTSRAFTDPQRVASDFLAAALKLTVPGMVQPTEKRRAQGRVVYEWQQANKPEIYTVVASRPYWLSFYAHNPKRVAWVVVAAYVSSCANNPVTRIR